MADPGLGHKSFMQIGRETVFGTGVAATRRLGFIESTIGPRQGIIRGRTLADSISRSQIYQGSLAFEGTITTVLDYHTMLFLIDGVMGTATYGSNGGSTTGGSPYTHTFIEKSLLNSYTIELGEGNVPAGRCQRLRGAKIRGVTIRGTAGEGDGALVTAQWDIIAKNYDTNQAVTALGAPAAEIPILVSEASALDDGTNDVFSTTETVAVAGTIATGTTFTRSAGSNTTDGIVPGVPVTGGGVPAGTTVLTVTSPTVVVLSAAGTPGAQTLTFYNVTVRITDFTLTLSNRLADRRFMIGSANPQEALRNDFIELSLQMRKEFTTTTMLADHVNTFTAGSPKFVFGSTTSKRMTFDVGTAYITQYTHPISGYGIVEQNVTWEPVKTVGGGYDTALKWVSETTTATIS